MRIVGIKPLPDEIGMGLVLGEDDRLPEAIPTGNLLTVGHQMLQHLVHRILVEEPLIDFFRLHASGRIPLFVPLHGIPLLLLLFGELVVGNPFALEL